MIIFNITAILETNHTILSDENLKLKNSNGHIEIYLNLD